MEESRALARLGEAADLLILLEDVLNPSSIERLSPSAWSGLRLTLKNARLMLQESQTSLAKDFVARARGASVQNSNNTEATANSVANRDNDFQPSSAISAVPVNGEQAKALITRRDLKASLEKFIESRS